MNKINVVLALTMVFSMLSCSQDEFQNMDLMQNHVTATISDATHARTALGDGGKVLWLSEDDISVVYKTGYHYRYVVSGDVNSASTKFSIDNSTAVINWGSTLSEGYNYAIYPYSGNNTASGVATTVNVDVSSWATQNYVTGTFEDDKAIMTAKSADTEFSFTNAFSLLNIQLKAEVLGSYSVSSISVTSNSCPLNGTAAIDMSAEKPALACTGTAETNRTNTLSFAENVELTTDSTNFYLLVPAKDYEANDLTIKINGKNLIDEKEFEWSHTMTEVVSCLRSKVTTLKKTFFAVDFSGSTGGVN